MASISSAQSRDAATVAGVAWWVRWGLVALAVPQAFTGIWAIADSSGWFDRFPGFDPRLVAASPPYNAHLASDAGAGFLATAVALVGAAWWFDRRTARLALLTYLAFAVPHLVYHAAHPASRLSGAANAGNIISLSVAVAFPLVLWWGTTDSATRRTTQSGEPTQTATA